MSDVIIYNDGELEINVSIEQETVWLNRNQLSELFDRDVKTIGKHINNVFKDKELDKLSVVAKFATVQKEGGREVSREIEYYNLDVIISVGYRVKSKKGVHFRQGEVWFVESNLKMGLQSHQKAETKVSVPSRHSYKDQINNIIRQKKVCA